MATQKHAGVRGRATIRDIAELAGVSVATVSRVINDRPDVAPETRDAVLRHVRAHNFTTNRSARALSGGRTGLVGWAMPLVRGDYFAAILSGALEAVYEQELRMVLCTTLHEYDREVSLLERLADGTTDGGIILLPEESSDELVALQESGYPVRRCRPARAPGRGHPRRLAAHRAGAKAATDHLLALGHRRIAHVTRPPGLGCDRRTSRGLPRCARRGGRASDVRPRRRGHLRGAERLRGGERSPRPAESADRDLRGKRQHGRGVLRAAHEREHDGPGRPLRGRLRRR